MSAGLPAQVSDIVNLRDYPIQDLESAKTKALVEEEFMRLFDE